jgi:Holliday junction DNA helicase RuvA
MISSISGVVTDIDAKFAVVETASGVGYQVFVSAKTAASLTAGASAKLFTQLVVKEDLVALYGFTGKAEREIFTLVQKVSGVGPKMAIALFDYMNADEFYGAVQSGDHTAFQAVSGIGPKLAQKIILELKGQVDLTEVGEPQSSAAQQAVEGLNNLGWKRAEAAAAVNKVLKDGADAGDTAALLKGALKLLGDK